MAATASDNTIAISIFAAQDLYYHVKPNAAVGIFTYVFLIDYSIVISTQNWRIRLIGSQLIGYGLAGT